MKHPPWLTSSLVWMFATKFQQCSYMVEEKTKTLMSKLVGTDHNSFPVNIVHCLGSFPVSCFTGLMNLLGCTLLIFLIDFSWMLWKQTSYTSSVQLLSSPSSEFCVDIVEDLDSSTYRVTCIFMSSY